VQQFKEYCKNHSKKKIFLTKHELNMNFLPPKIYKFIFWSILIFMQNFI